MTTPTFIFFFSFLKDQVKGCEFLRAIEEAMGRAQLPAVHQD